MPVTQVSKNFKNSFSNWIIPKFDDLQELREKSSILAGNMYKHEIPRQDTSPKVILRDFIYF
ncbi:hypothetical protein DMZ48_16680 [Robertkochia solimangrovi]|nr:hypothetical protein DMZ48_16680 [Robertkochia solimangrovi]